MQTANWTIPSISANTGVENGLHSEKQPAGARHNVSRLWPVYKEFSAGWSSANFLCSLNGAWRDAPTSLREGQMNHICASFSPREPTQIRSNERGAMTEAGSARRGKRNGEERGEERHVRAELAPSRATANSRADKQRFRTCEKIFPHRQRATACHSKTIIL